MVSSASESGVDEDSVPMIESDSDGEESVCIQDMAGPPKAFMEIYSPVRVAAAVQRAGLVSAGSFDITNGCDLLTVEGRGQVLRALETERPIFLMSSPPCTMYSELMRVFNIRKMCVEDWLSKQENADDMLTFGMRACYFQQSFGRFYAHEHPQRASSWSLPCVPRNNEH